MRNFFSKKSNKAEGSQTFWAVNKKTDTSIEDRLIQSEIRYRRLFESAKDGILILDFETGEIIDANPFIIEIIDHPLHEIVGKQLWEIGLFSNKEESEQAVIELKAKGYIRFEDMPIQRQNGKITEVEFISNVYLENNTRVIQCNIRNITERKQEEKKQQLSARIIAILNNEENLKQALNEIIDEIRKFIGIEAIGIRLKRNGNYPYFVSKGFTDHFIQIENNQYSINEKGEIIRDENETSHQKSLSIEIILAQPLPDIPYVTDRGSFYSNAISELIECAEVENKYTTLNRSKAEGFKSIALIPLYSGKTRIGLLHLSDKHADMISLDMVHFFEEIGNSIGITYTRIQNENKIRESEQSLKRQNNEINKLNNEYVILNEELTTSLSHIQNMNEELIHSKIKAEESDKLKTAFLANMSHEIRTPMNAIMGFSEFLIQPGITKEKLADYANIINKSGHQLLSVISDIIEISKIEAGQISIEFELVNINSLMNEIFEIYKRIVELKKLNLNCLYDHSADSIEVNTDGNRIKQIFCNLLNNALKFTRQGKIEFGYTVKENYIEFYVTDTGIGISPENHDLIFQRFRQVEVTDKQIYGGNGLGLSISKALVEKLGGKISIFSELKKGSTFVFTIPNEIVVEKKVSAEVEPNSPESVNWSDRTLLIVEDEINNHTYLEELLNITKAKIIHAWDGREAVEKVRTHPEISLVLMDVKLPVMNGYEATKVIKQLKPNLPVIAQTAYALSHDKRQAIEAGCNDYLSKPINKIQFIKVLNRYLSFSEVTTHK